VLEFEGHIAVASSTGRRALLGAFKHSVVICNLETGACSNRLETTFDAGGHRLALSDELDGVLAGAYDVHGLAFYCCETRRERWRRKDIKKIQRLTLSRDGLTAFCGREGSLLVVIDLCNGETKHTIRGAHALYQSSFDAVQFLDASRPQLLDGAGERMFFVARETFAFLDVSFAPGVLVTSEAAGPVRCIETSTGKERWRYQPKPGRHVLHIGYRKSDFSLLGVEWPFEKGGGKKLIHWSLTSGEPADSRILGHPVDCCFGLDGEVIVFADGQVLATANWCLPSNNRLQRTGEE
jgi:hypothetical protein